MRKLIIGVAAAASFLLVGVAWNAEATTIVTTAKPVTYSLVEKTGCYMAWGCPKGQHKMCEAKHTNCKCMPCAPKAKK
jgi:hypothetical protein